MALSIGIVGLPNVGKSTVFNALTQAQNAEVANYPFCTIQPNRAIVAVPDGRLTHLAEMVEHKSVTPATVEFVDIAGLVKGASHGEGLGNQFLGQIRETAAILHVVRCFDDDNVVHIQADPDPIADIEVVNLELILADLQQLESRIEKLSRQVKGDRALGPVLDTAHALITLLEAGRPLSDYDERHEAPFQALDQEMRFLSAKPVLYVANVDEDAMAADNDFVQEVREYAAGNGAGVVKICAGLEEEMIDIADDERHEYLALAGVSESGLEQVIHSAFSTLDLISYFTTDSGLIRAWNIRRGWTAPQAAGVIHTDFERGFIRAEVISYAIFKEQGSEAAAKAAGLMRVEGKDYVVQDGDVVHFRFNV